MRARQGKARHAVVENRGRPGNGVMAARAIRHRKGRTGGRVHRVIRLLPGRQVALRIPAIRGSDLKIVVVVDMAGRARHIRMAVCQRKPGGAVIELCPQPAVKRVAGGTKRCRETRPRLSVIRIRSLLIIRKMA